LTSPAGHTTLLRMREFFFSFDCVSADASFVALGGERR